MIDEIRQQQLRTFNIIKADAKDKKPNLALYRSSITGVLKYLIITSRASAKRKKLEFNLDRVSLFNMYKAQNGLCALSGLKMTITASKLKRINNYNISIDRIDSSKGYTMDNVHLVCASINIMKLDHSIEEFIELCKIVTKFNV